MVNNKSAKMSVTMLHTMVRVAARPRHRLPLEPPIQSGTQSTHDRAKHDGFRQTGNQVRQFGGPSQLRQIRGRINIHHERAHGQPPTLRRHHRWPRDRWSSQCRPEFLEPPSAKRINRHGPQGVDLLPTFMVPNSAAMEAPAYRKHHRGQHGPSSRRKPMPATSAIMITTP